MFYHKLAGWYVGAYQYPSSEDLEWFLFFEAEAIEFRAAKRMYQATEANLLVSAANKFMKKAEQIVAEYKEEHQEMVRYWFLELAERFLRAGQEPDVGRSHRAFINKMWDLRNDPEWDGTIPKEFYPDEIGHQPLKKKYEDYIADRFAARVGDVLHEVYAIGLHSYDEIAESIDDIVLPPVYDWEYLDLFGEWYEAIATSAEHMLRGLDTYHFLEMYWKYEVGQHLKCRLMDYVWLVRIRTWQIMRRDIPEEEKDRKIKELYETAMEGKL